MIKSMTGYGRAKLSKDDREYQIEIKSVNHRYLDISVRIPKQLSYLEETIKKEIAKKVKRGKIDVFVTFENNSLEGKEIKINTELAKAYIDELKKLAEKENILSDIQVTEISKYPDVLNIQSSQDDEKITEEVLETITIATDNLVQMRETEGNKISEDLLKIRKNTFLEKEIGKAFLVVAATSNREENHHIAELCHAYNVLVNVADSEEESSFIFPSVVRKGDISIGINSGTGSPTVSKHIRKQIEKAVPDYYADIAVFMGKLREYVKANFKEESQRRYILKTAAAEAFAEERVLTQKEIEEIIRQGPK